MNIQRKDKKYIWLLIIWTVIAGNKNLKLPNAKEYIDSETFKFRMEELRKISEDISYFAENYFYIISLDSRKIIDKTLPETGGTYKNNVYRKTSYLSFLQTVLAKTGKCIISDSKITIRNKHTGKIEEITIEDFFNKNENAAN